MRIICKKLVANDFHYLLLYFHGCLNKQRLKEKKNREFLSWQLSAIVMLLIVKW
tara:strand:+ start:855 stop:1016 length:162 start_codon:yes stop_codon:yes gene_type:complete